MDEEPVVGEEPLILQLPIDHLTTTVMVIALAAHRQGKRYRLATTFADGALAILCERVGEERYRAVFQDIESDGSWREKVVDLSGPEVAMAALTHAATCLRVDRWRPWDRDNAASVRNALASRKIGLSGGWYDTASRKGPVLAAIAGGGDTP